MKKRKSVRRKPISKAQTSSRAPLRVAHSSPFSSWVALFHHSAVAIPKTVKVHEVKKVKVKLSFSFGSGWVSFLEQHLKDVPARQSTLKTSKQTTSIKHILQSILDKFDALFKKRTKDSANLHITIGQNETGVDALLREIQKRDHVSLEQVEATFNVSKELAEEWAKILEAKGLIELGYPAFGSLVLKKPTEKKGDENEA